MQAYFGCGSIRPDRSDKTLKWETRRLDDLVERVIPHFERYPLLSGKRLDFERFASVCRLIAAGAHRDASWADRDRRARSGDESEREAAI